MPARSAPLVLVASLAPRASPAPRVRWGLRARAASMARGDPLARKVIAATLARVVLAQREHGVTKVIAATPDRRDPLDRQVQLAPSVRVDCPASVDSEDLTLSA